MRDFDFDFENGIVQSTFFVPYVNAWIKCMCFNVEFDGTRIEMGDSGLDMLAPAGNAIGPLTLKI